MFIGEFNCKMDTKGRITFPSKFREQLTDGFVITRGLDNCVDLFTLEKWKEQLAKLEKINFYISIHRSSLYKLIFNKFVRIKQFIER